MLNKGAMFGLDARIALAIFGALSVISGAALYSAIQESKVTQQLAQIKEIEKAIEQYILDTGSMVPFSATVPTADLSIAALVEKPTGVTGWNGPYLSLEKGSGDYLNRQNKTGKVYALTYSAVDDWTAVSSSKNCTKSSAACAVYVVHVSDLDFQEEFEKKLDGSTTANYLTGNVREKIGHLYIKTNIPFAPSSSPNT
jgi:type II secretory pathway pseudopilin PulG